MDGLSAILAFFAVPAIGLLIAKLIELFAVNDNEPDKETTVSIANLKAVCRLRDGLTLAETTTWSGRQVKPLGLFLTPSMALDRVIPFLVRSGADLYRVQENSPMRFEIIRDEYAHAGRARGKKVGGAILLALPQDAEARSDTKSEGTN